MIASVVRVETKANHELLSNWLKRATSDDKQPAKSFVSNGLILAVLIVTGTAVYTHRAPLQGARPPITETPIHQEVAMEDVEARLWQDPFGAVAKQSNDQLAKEASGKLARIMQLRLADVAQVTDLA